MRRADLRPLALEASRLIIERRFHEAAATLAVLADKAEELGLSHAAFDYRASARQMVVAAWVTDMYGSAELYQILPIRPARDGDEVTRFSVSSPRGAPPWSTVLRVDQRGQVHDEGARSRRDPVKTARDGASKTLRTLRSIAEEQGWRVERTRANHYRFVPPDRSKRIVLFSANSSPQNVRNTYAELRRSGLVLPEGYA